MARYLERSQRIIQRLHSHEQVWTTIGKFDGRCPCPEGWKVCEKLIEVAGFPRFHDTMSALSVCRRARKGCFIMGAATVVGIAESSRKKMLREYSWPRHEIKGRAANNSPLCLGITFVNAVKFVARCIDFTAFLEIRGVRRDKYAGTRLVFLTVTRRRFACSFLPQEDFNFLEIDCWAVILGWCLFSFNFFWMHFSLISSQLLYNKLYNYNQIKNTVNLMYNIFFYNLYNFWSFCFTLFKIIHINRVYILFIFICYLHIYIYICIYTPEWLNY